MAVWGTLVAAERTVRAGLDLVAAVAELGAEAEEQDRPGSGLPCGPTRRACGRFCWTAKRADRLTCDNAMN